MSIEVNRLRPDPAPVELADQISGLGLADLAPGDRPYTVMNFAATLDGYGAIDGRSGPIGSEADTEVLVRLRTEVDAVMIGAGTMRAERYGPMPDGRPLVIVSGRLDLPWDAGAFTDAGGRVVIFTASDAEPPETAADVSVVRHEGVVDVASAVRHLHAELGVSALLCEGGPRLHGQLQDQGLADELFLTIAPKLAGGAAPHILEGELLSVIDMEQVWLLEHEGELFTRYRRRR